MPASEAGPAEDVPWAPLSVSHTGSWPCPRAQVDLCSTRHTMHVGTLPNSASCCLLALRPVLPSLSSLGRSPSRPPLTCTSPLLLCFHTAYLQAKMSSRHLNSQHVRTPKLPEAAFLLCPFARSRMLCEHLCRSWTHTIILETLGSVDRDKDNS